MLQKRTLLYLASGPYSCIYETLPYSKIFLLDKRAFYNKPELPQGTKVELLPMDVLKGIDALRSRNIEIDCLVTINEGLIEGGGKYPMLVDSVFGYLAPILAKDLLLVADFSYYKVQGIYNSVIKLDAGYKQHRKLRYDDDDFIYPYLFSGNRDSYNNLTLKNKFGTVIWLKKENRERNICINNKLKVIVKHRSIWEDNDELDAIGLSVGQNNKGEIDYYSKNINKYFSTKPKVFFINDMSFNDIINYCKINKIKNLGLLPWLNDNYKELLEKLSNFNEDYPKEIRFYHINRDDYSDLYGWE
jgi:hypothetical protein